jgi:hypothetical protein
VLFSLWLKSCFERRLLRPYAVSFIIYLYPQINPFDVHIRIFADLTY